MARARNIKPGFFKNEDLAECSIWARFIFPGLWMLADREGRLEDRPKRIKGELLPFDAVEMEPLLAELDARKFILRYSNADGRFIQILQFERHQSPHYSEKGSVIKPPPISELPPHQAASPPGEHPEDSEKPPAIKRGPQPPDSLNPDSLNPDSLFADSPNPDKGKTAHSPGNGGNGKAKNTAADAARVDPVKDEIWKKGRALLEGQGDTREAAGNYLGKLVKDFGQVLVLDAIRDCERVTPAEAKGWLVARCQERRKAGPSSGLEARNAAAGSTWVPPEARP